MLCAMTFTGNSVYTGSSSGQLMHTDIRSKAESSKSYDLTEKKIACLDVNPQDPTKLMASGLDRHFRIYDTRMLDDSEKCVLGEFETDKSCTGAYFNHSGDQVVCTSYDDTVSPPLLILTHGSLLSLMFSLFYSLSCKYNIHVCKCLIQFV